MSFRSLFVLLSIIAFSSCNSVQQTQEALARDAILDHFMKLGDFKQLFKVYHFIFERSQDYEINSEIGIQRYRTFRENLKIFEEHNRTNKDYTLGITQHSDRTHEELMAYYNIPKNGIPLSSVKRMLKGYSLDDFNESDEIDVTPQKLSDDPPQNTPIDYTSLFNPVKNQGGCGSCWTFSTMGAIEGSWAKNKGSKVTLAEQQLVDCNDAQKPYGGCQGGWMKTAMTYLKASPPMLLADYPYRAKQETCKYNSAKTSSVRLTGFESPKSYADAHRVLLSGPIASCINIQSSYWNYKSGLYSPACTAQCHHAIVNMGFGTDSASKLQFWKGRNSWGTGWGEAGYFRVKHDEKNSGSCMMQDYRFNVRPILG